MMGFSNAWGEISIQNDRQYFGNDGALHIVGEIQNDLNAPVNQVIVFVTLFSDGQLLDTKSTSSFVNTIMPGMKGPFDLVIFGDQSKSVDEYTLDVNFKVADPKRQVIDITNSEFLRDEFDNLAIKGIVTNRGEITANTVVVVATLYDRDGKVAAVSKAHTEPDYLQSNDESFFLILVPDKIQSQLIVDYSLVAESEEYAAVPEFPLGSMVLLASSVSAYILLTRYSDRLITNLVSATNPK
jgi:hypothetical protein